MNQHRQALRVGVGGPVGSGKTALLEFKLLDEVHDVNAALKGTPPPGSVSKLTQPAPAGAWLRRELDRRGITARQAPRGGLWIHIELPL